MKSGRGSRICIFVFFCIFINFGGKLLAESLQLPVWMDAIGTLFAAYALGPVCGAIIGVTSNIMYSIINFSAFWYAPVGILTGILVGNCARKGFLKELFGVLSTAFAVTVVSVVFSVPVNFIIADGAVGNIWGDGIIALLRKIGTKDVVSCILGEFYVDFLDKTLSMLLLFLAVKIISEKNRKQNKEDKKSKKKLAGFWVIVLLSFTFMPGWTVYAEENGEGYEFEKYIRITYDDENGLKGGMANDIVQTKDGVLWIGTYGGLYRYGGTEIEWMDDIEAVRTVNCLYTDEAGRLWIGTNDNGLAIFINDRVTNVLNKKAGFPSNSVRCITESSNGLYYVGTTDSLVVVTLSSGLKVYDTIPEILYTKSICADAEGNIVAVTDKGLMYLIRGTEIIAKRKMDRENEMYTSCTFDEDGKLYAGSSVNTVEVFDISGGQLEKQSEMECGELSGINSLTFSDEGILLICADNGAGYLHGEGRYFDIDMNSFNSSIEKVLVDYQGNLWFTSSRLGLMCLCCSVFNEINVYDGLSGNVVNTVLEWQNEMYIGTDSGLEIIKEKSGKRENGLTEALKNIRIRCLMEDSYGNLWICTSGKGIWMVSEDGKITKYDSKAGAEGDKFRSVMEMKNGVIAAAGDYGITFIENGKISGKIAGKEGLTNPKVLSLCEREDGTILAGTDGNGIAVLYDGKVIKTFKQEDGLSSEIILRIVRNKDENGFFIVTGNGLCYMDSDENIRVLENFPYYNNYDILEGGNGELFVLSSAGIYIVDKEELLSGAEVKYLLLDARKGLRVALTPNAWNYMDEEGNLYLSGDMGVVHFNVSQYDISVRSYRMILKEIVADGESIAIEKGTEIVIPAGTASVVITPEIVNFSINDPKVSMYMENLDVQPKVMLQSEMSSVTYANLPAGRYTFHLAILDSRTGDVIVENTYKLVKEREIYENWWFKLYACTVAVITVAYLTWMVVRTQIQKTLRMQKMELDFARNQIKMSNETILTIAKTVDAKDENTSQHSVRVSEYSVMIAERMGYSRDECENLRKMAMLHDIGKIGIPDSVLNKPAGLTDAEYAIMKSHVTRGAEILKNFTMIENVADGALYHHERYDGKGYVHGLKGEEIPLNARIIGISDAFDAMTANRVYRKKLDLDFVLNELKKGSGTQFDPKLVEIMLELLTDGTIRIDKIYGTTRDE